MSELNKRIITSIIILLILFLSLVNIKILLALILFINYLSLDEFIRLIKRKIKNVLFKITSLKKLGLIRTKIPYVDITNRKIKLPKTKVDSIDKKIVFIKYKTTPYFIKNLII